MEPKINCRECGAALQAESPSGYCGSCLIALSLEEFEKDKRNPPPGELEWREAEKAGLLPTTPSSVYGNDIKSKGNPFSSSFRTERPGDRIGRYRLLQEIGQGGCGIVYMAEQEEPVRRKVALKVIKLGMDTRQVVARFEAERQALAMMDHPNIAMVLDAGSTETGRPYFVMELVGGIKITDYCNRQNLATHQRLELFIKVCHAIQHAHQKGIIHRDIKPSNVLVATQDGQPVPKVIDFGIAKATQGRLTDSTMFTAFDQFMGTPAYMSPEQTELGGVDVDTRSDIYSLGVLLYELLTGRTPAEKKDLAPSSIEELRRTIREKEPLRPSNRLSTLGAGELTTMAAQHQSDPIKLIALVQGDLDWIVMKCLEKDRSRRYETADGLAQDLERYLRNETVSARPPSHVYTLQKLYRRNRLVVTAGMLIATVTLLGIVGIFWQWGRAERHAELELDHRKRAEVATREAQKALRQMEAIEIRRAEEYMTAADRRNMLPYLALVLRQNPSNSTAAERVFSTLSHRHWSRLACPPLTHANSITSASFSRDGRLVATSSADYTARVWDANTGKPVCNPLKHNAEINTVEFSPDGRFVVTASDDHSARVWDAHTGAAITNPILLPDRVEMARFSPDGQLIVTLCDDRTAMVWDAKTGKSVAPPLRHGAGPPRVMFFKELDFSPDGQLLATASKENGIVRIWRIKTGEVVHKLLQPGDEVTCVRFSPNGQLFAACSSTNFSTIWNLTNTPPQPVEIPQPDGADSIEFSPEGSRVIIATRAATAQVWDAFTGSAIGHRLRHGRPVRSAMFSPDGLRVVTSSLDQTIRIWDAERGEPVNEPIRLEAPAYYAVFHPDGQRVLSASMGNSVFIWGASSLVSVQVPGQHVIDYSQFSPNGTRAVVCGDKGFVQMIDPWGIEPPIELSGLQGQVTCAAFTPDGKYVTAAANDGVAQVWLAANGQTVGSPLKLGGLATPSLNLRLTPDGKRLFTASSSGAAIWNILTGSLIRSFRRAEDSAPPQLSPDGKWVVEAGTNYAVRILDSDSGKPVSRMITHDDKVLSFQFTQDSSRLLTASADKSVRVWKVPSGECEAIAPQHSMDILTARFNKDGKEFLTVVPEKPGVRVWESSSGKLLVELTIENARIAEFSPDGKRIIVGFKSGSSQLYDSATGERISETLPSHGDLQSADFSPDGKLIALISDSGPLRFYEVTRPALPVPLWVSELAEALSGQRFNQDGRLETVSPDQLWNVQSKILSGAIPENATPASQGEPLKNMWLTWAKWFLAPPHARPVFPSSAVSIPKYAELLADGSSDYEITRESLMLCPTNLTCLISCALTATNPAIAEWFSARASSQAAPGSREWQKAVEARKRLLQDPRAP